MKLMDSSSVMSKSGKDDAIGNLPDEIIGLILSFIPTKDAVCTSVLSKRWKSMWKLVTVLDFDDKKISSQNHFVEFVDGVLHRLSDSTIRSFALSISEKHDSSTVNGWISAALGLGVEKLLLKSRVKLSLSLHSLSKSKFLQELVLDMTNSVIIVPSFVCIPHLKSMTLSGIALRYSSEEINFSLPVLEKFVMINCTWSSKVTFTLPLAECITIMSSYFTVPLAESITIMSSDHSNMLFKQLNQVEYLKLNAYEVLVRGSSWADQPAFGKLRHLELTIFIDVETLLNLLQKSPHLRTLAFKGVHHPFDQELLDSAVVPNCMLSTLQMVKFGMLYSETQELSLAKFIVENAVVLEKMTLQALWEWRKKDTREERRILKKLKSFKKGSKSATIIQLSSFDNRLVLS